MTKAFFCDVLRRKKSLKYLPHFGNTKISYSSSWWSDWSATGPCSPWPTPPRPTPRWLRTSGGTSWPTTRTSSGRWTLWGIWRWRIRARGRCSWQSEIFWALFDGLKKNVYACLQEGLKWMSLKEYYTVSPAIARTIWNIIAFGKENTIVDAFLWKVPVVFFIMAFQCWHARLLKVMQLQISPD